MATYLDKKRSLSNVPIATQRAIMLILALLMGIGFAKTVLAETYVINGTKDQTKLAAIVAAAKDPKSKIERCKFTEKTDSNEGAIVCRTVELSPRGTLRLQK